MILEAKRQQIPSSWKFNRYIQSHELTKEFILDYSRCRWNDSNTNYVCSQLHMPKAVQALTV